MNTKNSQQHLLDESEVLIALAAQKSETVEQPPSPEELADFFVFMCSPKASYCVGSTYYVDGGWLNVVE